MTIRDRIFSKLEELEMTPEWLLSGVEPQGHRGNPREWYAIDADTESGRLITAFNAMDKGLQQRLLGYAEALSRHQ